MPSDVSVSSTDTSLSVPSESTDDKAPHPSEESHEQVEKKYHALLSTMEQKRTHHGRGLVDASPNDYAPKHFHDFPPRNVQKHEKLEKHVRTGLPTPDVVQDRHIVQPLQDKPNPCSAKLTRMY
ncbi:hypothetical protein DYB25_007780 [Aphanomyces astaci]|uniref:Uncharacterized protein n=2 Tax=Aphanomyces astaci TaxID=112090 RepID=A0A397B915_APHAT|nr:hypothetical protein DYB36_009200 [Aphanomyces astaci]RHY26930.1 hypothetical protein DYB25_007780 [Aphanomyces astaci]